jgi:hypothetical protein
VIRYFKTCVLCKRFWFSWPSVRFNIGMMFYIIWALCVCVCVCVGGRSNLDSHA